MAMPVLAALHVPTAAELSQVTTQIDSLTSQGWVTYTPTWTSSGTAPAIGNATIVAGYRRPTNSNSIEVRVKITFGTTSTYGTGVYFFSLPVTAATGDRDMPAGWAWALDAGTKESAGICKVESSGTTFRCAAAPVAAGLTDSWGQTVPFAWGTSDVFKARLQYEV